MSSTQYVDVDRTLTNLSETKLHPDDVQAIRTFIDHCAAEGISEVRQARLASALKNLVLKVAPDDFHLPNASEADLKQMIAALNRSDYAKSTKHTFRSAVKKFYKVENGGHEEPAKTKFFAVGKPDTTVTRDDLFTDDELKQLFQGVTSTRDRALVMTLYESAARPGEILLRNIGDFTATGGGDFIHLTGVKDTPDRTNQLVRAGRTLREWLAQHPLGGELGDIADPTAPLWVKTEQQACVHCGAIPHNHDEACDYTPDQADRLNYGGFYRRFQQACSRAEIPENKRRPYNLRHTRLTEVATFMGYEQLNKFAGWKPGSDRAKVYVHLTNDDVNQAIRDEYGLTGDGDTRQQAECPFCNATNQASHSECRRCGRPLSLEQQMDREDDLQTLERLKELEEQGVLDKLDELERLAKQ
ncbi:tyrosine-type recombinase/integrase [Natrinema sp. 1APR25-10V2]|uniref:tyrosine-type recombinase/integrase n=1 Tax=Natrinema sp. 1APR25-10V2 TaxID=2951081 RepID=UPI0028755696|nr:tyrosine-type recombinase/integrase [Natrinema sp. 1APR25-10V2]MDS0476847.1 tyrosine-type recombinase/integrase [Natrinema sp. 1APR25-10V2]